MKINRYNNKQIEILKALAKYKFLTYHQMTKLGIDAHSSNLSTLIKKMREQRYPLVKKIPHTIGTPVKHYLTSKGQEILIQLCNLDEKEIHFPKGVIHTDTQDTKHRTSIIDIQIELNLACSKKGIEVILCDRYFDVTGSRREKNLASKTAIIYEAKKTLKADLNFILKIKKQKELYLTELENGKDTKKAIEKCVNHAKAILIGSANKKYQFNKGYRSLWIFEHESIMENTIKGLQKTPIINNLREYFLFKSLEEISNENFFTDWHNAAGDKRKLYYAKHG